MISSQKNVLMKSLNSFQGLEVFKGKRKGVRDLFYDLTFHSRLLQLAGQAKQLNI